LEKGAGAEARFQIWADGTAPLALKPYPFKTISAKLIRKACSMLRLYLFHLFFK